MENRNTKVNFVIKGLCEKVIHLKGHQRFIFHISLKVVEENISGGSVSDFNDYIHPLYPLQSSYFQSKMIQSNNYKFPPSHYNKILSYIGNKIASPLSYISSSQFHERKSRRSSPYKRITTKPNLDLSTPFLELLSYSF